MMYVSTSRSASPSGTHFCVGQGGNADFREIYIFRRCIFKIRPMADKSLSVAPWRYNTYTIRTLVCIFPSPRHYHKNEGLSAFPYLSFGTKPSDSLRLLWSALLCRRNRRIRKIARIGGTDGNFWVQIRIPFRAYPRLKKIFDNRQNSVPAIGWILFRHFYLFRWTSKIQLARSYNYIQLFLETTISWTGNQKNSGQINLPRCYFNIYVLQILTIRI